MIERNDSQVISAWLMTITEQFKEQFKSMNGSNISQILVILKHEDSFRSWLHN